MDIRFIKQQDIDIQKYDSCIHYSTNGNIFGYHWFLNNTARDWDLLVEGDNYVTVMPLPWVRNRWGRYHLQQPTLIPELAVYSCKPLSHKRIQAFWDAIPKQYRGGTLTVEPASVPKEDTRFNIHAARGSALFLNRSYESIIADLPPNFSNDVAKAELANLRPKQSFKPERLAEFWWAQQEKTPENEWRFHAMQRLMYQVLHRGWGGTFAVADASGHMQAMVFIVYSHQRIFPLFTVESKEGAEVGAMAYLWDVIFQSHARKKLKLKKEDVFF